MEATVIEGRESPPQGWVSLRFYQRAPAPVLSVRATLAAGQILRTVIRRQDSIEQGRQPPQREKTP